MASARSSAVRRPRTQLSLPRQQIVSSCKRCHLYIEAAELSALVCTATVVFVVLGALAGLVRLGFRSRRWFANVCNSQAQQETWETLRDDHDHQAGSWSYNSDKDSSAIKIVTIVVAVAVAVVVVIIIVVVALY